MGNLYPNAKINKAVKKFTLTDGLHKLEISQNPNSSKIINLSYSYKERKGTRTVSIQDSCSVNKNKLYTPLEIFKYFDKFKNWDGQENKNLKEQVQYLQRLKGDLN